MVENPRQALTSVTTLVGSSSVKARRRSSVIMVWVQTMSCPRVVGLDLLRAFSLQLLEGTNVASSPSRFDAEPLRIR